MSSRSTRLLGGLFLAAAFYLSVAAAAFSQSLQVPGSGWATDPAKADAAATLVVFNEGDAASRELATFYAGKRAIPKEQVVGLRCSNAEEISREEYDATIAEPLRRALTANFWWKLREPDNPLGPVEWNKIRYVALIRGVPLKIRPTANYPGDKPSGPPPIAQHNEASVDSELALLASRGAISGAIVNSYHRSFSRISDAQRPDLMLVCRLDAPTPDVVRRMIIDSIAAEKEGLRGFAYVDARGLGSDNPGMKEGDDWLHSVAGNARKRGIPVILDNGPALFPDQYPMRHAALYFGWYTEQVSATFKQPGFRFKPGAIAVHIHSFSAQTLRAPARHWAAPLLEEGAAATLGNVYEPYLSLTPRLDVFYERLASGFTFAESAYMAQRALSWMTTFIGDPLYRPFQVAGLGGPEKQDEWSAYEDGARVWFDKGKEAGEGSLAKSARGLRSGAIAEGLGLLHLTGGAPNKALEAFNQARGFYREPADQIRATVHACLLLRANGREREAIALAEKQVAAHPSAPASKVLYSLFPAMSPGGVAPASQR